jgi:hypothetical protein
MGVPFKFTRTKGGASVQVDGKELTMSTRTVAITSIVGEPDYVSIEVVGHHLDVTFDDAQVVVNVIPPPVGFELVSEKLLDGRTRYYTRETPLPFFAPVLAAPKPSEKPPEIDVDGI